MAHMQLCKTRDSHSSLDEPRPRGSGSGRHRRANKVSVVNLGQTQRALVLGDLDAEQ